MRLRPISNGMSKLLIANWKMNPLGGDVAISLAKKIDEFAMKNKNVSVGIAPAFPHITLIPKLKSAWLGAQDFFWENPENGGAYTGEVSINMLKSIGATFSIIGHSERRINLGETDEMINKKVKTATVANFFNVLCVGEPLSIRKKGFSVAKKYVADQLKKGLKGVVGFPKFGVIAYEPIWAISTNKNAKSDNPKLASEMADYIKKITKSDVLYGGSLNSKNAKDFLSEPSINGALVGGASLKADEFGKIIEIANNI